MTKAPTRAKYSRTSEMTEDAVRACNAVWSETAPLSAVCWARAAPCCWGGYQSGSPAFQKINFSMCVLSSFFFFWFCQHIASRNNSITRHYWNCFPEWSSVSWAPWISKEQVAGRLVVLKELTSRLGGDQQALLKEEGKICHSQRNPHQTCCWLKVQY